MAHPVPRDWLIGSSDGFIVLINRRKAMDMNKMFIQMWKTWKETRHSCQKAVETQAGAQAC